MAGRFLLLPYLLLSAAPTKSLNKLCGRFGREMNSG